MTDPDFEERWPSRAGILDGDLALASMDHGGDDWTRGLRLRLAQVHIDVEIRDPCVDDADAVEMQVVVARE